MPFCKPDILKKVVNDLNKGTITFMENEFHPERKRMKILLNNLGVELFCK